MDWELLFKPHILHRGAEYYRDAPSRISKLQTRK